jgi:hypothetical protein
VARRQRRRGASAASAAAAGNAAQRRAQGYREFFVQTVPVAPNRFRPVNHVGEMVGCLLPPVLPSSASHCVGDSGKQPSVGHP